MRDREIIFSQQQRNDIEQQLRYINFVSKRIDTPHCDRAKVYAVFEATMSLSGSSYTPEQLRKVLADGSDMSAEAVFARRYYTLVASLLEDHIDRAFDESRIISFYTTLYDAPRSRRALQPRMTVADILLQNAPQASNDLFVYGDELSELVEWYGVQCSRPRYVPLEAIASFLYYMVHHNTLPQGREWVMHLVMLLLLRLSGYDWVAFSGPACTMNAQRIDYRRALFATAGGSDNCAAWIAYFVNIIYDMARQVSAQDAPSMPLLSASHKSVLNSRQQAILQFIAHQQPVGLSAIVKHLHKESINTVKKDLQRMRELGYIATEGVLKGTVYYKI